MKLSRSRPPVPWSEKACAGLCLGFALWTIVCNLVVVLGGSLYRLMTAEAAAFAFAGVVLILMRRRRRPGENGATETTGDEAAHPPVTSNSDRPPVVPYTLPFKAAAVVLALLGLVAFPFFSRIVIYWWLGLAALLLGLFVLAIERWRLDAPEPRRSRAWEAALWGLALAAVIFNLFVHRPDPDDALYINIAASAADHPGQALMDRDMMQGIEGLPFHSPVYLSNSIEPLWGMMSWLTGIRAQLWFHGVHAGLGALFIVLAYSVLFRLLLPDRWLVGLVVFLILLLGAGGPLNHWYGNLAFVRVWQGKCTFLHVFLPLTFAYGMRFGMRPSLYGWVLLAAAQISAVGMSSSAIWVEPLAAGIGLLCGALGRGWAGWGRVMTGCFSSVWIIAVGLRLKSELSRYAERILRDDFRLRDYDAMVSHTEVLDRTGEALEWAWTNFMGHGPLIYLCLGSILISWTVCRHSLARRFAVLAPLLTLSVVMNPYIEKFVMANLTGPVYHRSSWLLPIPVFMTLLLMGALEIDPKQVPRRLVLGFMAIALLGYVLRASDFTTVEPANRIYYGPPGVKIHPKELEALEQAMEAMPAGSHVIAPTQVSFWFPTFHDPLYPVTVHKLYTYKRASLITSEEARWRGVLTEYVSGEARPERAPELLREGVDFFGVRGVIVDLHNMWREEVEGILREKGFEALDPPSDKARYQLWLRPSDHPAVGHDAGWKIFELRDPPETSGTPNAIPIRLPATSNS